MSLGNDDVLRFCKLWGLLREEEDEFCWSISHTALVQIDGHCIVATSG